MSGKYFYKGTDITTLFRSGTTAITGFSGITYAATPTAYLMQRPAVFNMSTSNGDITQYMTTPYESTSSTVATSNITVPSVTNAFSAVIAGGGGGGGGGAGCGYNVVAGRFSGGNGTAGNDGMMTISWPYVPIMPSSTLTYSIGAGGTKGNMGNDKSTSNSGSGANGNAGNAGTQSYITFVPASGPSTTYITLYARGGDGGGGGNAGNANSDGPNADSFPSSNAGPTVTIGPSVYIGPSPTYVTSWRTNLISPTESITTNIGNYTSPSSVIDTNQYGYKSNFSNGGNGGAGSKRGNPALAFPGNNGQSGYFKIFFYRI
jgi:hypothetical protein